jgi:hypothetical protein
MKAWITTAVAVGIALASAAPAQATESDFVQHVQERYAYLTADQIRTEGHRVCQLFAQGTAAPLAVQMVQRDLGSSIAAAAYIVSAAVNELSC